MIYQFRERRSQQILANLVNKENLNLPNITKRDLKPFHDPIILNQNKLILHNIQKQDLSKKLKEQYTEYVADYYSLNIKQTFIRQSMKSKITGFLNNHTISTILRSKMIDWMIQDSFFRSVYYMDKYFYHNTKKLQVKDLHLIGITCMFIATKYEQIKALRLNNIVEKIGKKKFSRMQILSKQSQIIKVLDFNLEISTVYDVVSHIINELDLELDNSMFKYFKSIALYLSKMCMFDSEFCGEYYHILGGCVVFVSLKTIEQMDELVQPQKFIPGIMKFLNLEEQNQLISISQKILQLAKNYSNVFPTLTNLRKFNKFQYEISQN